MNTATLIGRLGKNAETRQVGDSTVITFSLATSERYKTRDGEVREDTQWHSCEYWRKDGKLAEYLTSGKQVALTGQIRYDEYEKDGVRRYVTRIRVGTLELLGGKEGQTAAPAEQKPADAKPERKPLYEMAEESLEPQEQDLPF